MKLTFPCRNIMQFLQPDIVHSRELWELLYHHIPQYFRDSQNTHLPTLLAFPLGPNKNHLSDQLRNGGCTLAGMLDFRTLWQKVVQKRNTIVKEKSNLVKSCREPSGRHLFWDAWLGTSYQKSRRRLPPQAVPENPLFERRIWIESQPVAWWTLDPSPLWGGKDTCIYTLCHIYIYMYTYIDRKGYKFGLSELESRTMSQFRRLTCAPVVAALAAIIAILFGVRMSEELAATMCTQQHLFNIHLLAGYSEYLEWRNSCILLTLWLSLWLIHTVSIITNFMSKFQISTQSRAAMSPKNKGNTLIRFGYNRIEQGKAAYQQRPWVFRWSRYIRMNIFQQSLPWILFSKPQHGNPKPWEIPSDQKQNFGIKVGINVSGPPVHCSIKAGISPPWHEKTNASPNSGFILLQR